MARLKKSINKDIQKAQQRLDGMTAINPTLDLGEGVSVVALKATIDLIVSLIAQYNAILSQADDLLNQIVGAGINMNEMSNRAFDGVKFKFGADSSEYEMMGGVRKSERKKPVRKIGGSAAKS